MLDRLSPDDVQILKREGGAIRGHTCKVLVLEPSADRPLPSLPELREHIEARLDAAPRLRQRLVETPLRVARPVWLDDPKFDIARHVTAVRTDGPVSREGLEEIVAELMGERLDRAHPLWRIDIVEQLEDGAMALIWRIHHCLADGTTCMRFGAGVLWDTRPELPSRAPAPAGWTPATPPGAARLFALGLLDQSRRARRDQRGPSAAALGSRRRVLRRELGPRAELTPLADPIGGARQVAFARAPIDSLKRAGKRVGPRVTLNDVVLAIVTGGVRAWLEHAGGVHGGIRVKVPVSLHGGGEDHDANRDSYLFVDLPVTEPDSAARIRTINRETQERKLDRDAETLYRLGLHSVVAHWAMSPRVFTFNVSNVRGPATDIYVYGARVRELYSLAEIAHRHALRVAAISVGGSLFIGLCADRDAVKDLEVLAGGIRRSVDELLELAGL